MIGSGRLAVSGAAVLTFAVPVWVLILAVAVILVIILATERSRTKDEADKPVEPSPNEYRTDRIFDVDWQWRYLRGTVETLDRLVGTTGKSATRT